MTRNYRGCCRKCSRLTQLQQVQLFCVKLCFFILQFSIHLIVVFISHVRARSASFVKPADLYVAAAATLTKPASGFVTHFTSDKFWLIKLTTHVASVRNSMPVIYMYLMIQKNSSVQLSWMVPPCIDWAGWILGDCRLEHEIVCLASSNSYFDTSCTWPWWFEIRPWWYHTQNVVMVFHVETYTSLLYFLSRLRHKKKTDALEWLLKSERGKCQACYMYHFTKLPRLLVEYI